MEEAIRWAVWALTLIIPFLGLVWCLTTPVAQTTRDARVVETSPDR